MEDGERAVGVLVHTDAGPDVVGSGGSGGDLQDPVAVSHGVVVCDGALGLDAEDVVDLALTEMGVVCDGALSESG